MPTSVPMPSTSISLCLPYLSYHLCLIHMDKYISFMIPFLVHTAALFHIYDALLPDTSYTLFTLIRMSVYKPMYFVETDLKFDLCVSMHLYLVVSLRTLLVMFKSLLSCLTAHCSQNQSQCLTLHSYNSDVSALL